MYSHAMAEVILRSVEHSCSAAQSKFYRHTSVCGRQTVSLVSSRTTLNGLMGESNGFFFVVSPQTQIVVVSIYANMYRPAHCVENRNRVLAHTRIDKNWMWMNERIHFDSRDGFCVSLFGSPIRYTFCRMSTDFVCGATQRRRRHRPRVSILHWVKFMCDGQQRVMKRHSRRLKSYCASQQMPVSQVINWMAKIAAAQIPCTGIAFNKSPKISLAHISVSFCMRNP